MDLLANVVEVAAALGLTRVVSGYLPRRVGDWLGFTVELPKPVPAAPPAGGIRVA